jgi:hypothetical protein
VIDQLFLALNLIVVHGPNNQYLEINVDEISSIRTPQASGHFPRGTHCLITMTNGNFNAVQETCDAVDRLIKAVK